MAVSVGSESSSLYRKYRPAGFDELAGQPAVTSGLAEAVKTNRVVHAYLFSGPRGTGKTSAARILAKCLNCLTNGPRPDPCGVCDACVSIAAGTAFDVIEIDAASNRGIDEIRQLRERVKFAPSQFRMKVYIIDEVHMLTSEAFNALLKTLEEPPEYVVFVLATTELHRVPATILSRCQRYEFRRLAPATIAEQLQHVAAAEKIPIDAAAVERIAFLADGAMRDALVLLEQARGFAGGARIDANVLDQAFGQTQRELIEAVVDALIASDAAQTLSAIADAVDQGADPSWMTKELLRWFRLALLAQVSPSVLESEVPRDDAAQISRRAAKLARPVVFRALRALSEIGRWSSQPRVDLELALVRVLRPADELDLKRLSERLAEVEQRLGEPGGARPPEGAPPTGDGGTSARREEPRKPAKERKHAEPPRAPSGLTATILTAQWPRILNEVKAHSRQCFGWLGHARVAEASDELVTLDVEKKIYADQLSDGRFAQLIQDAIAQVSGARPRIRIVVGSPRPAGDTRNAGSFTLAENVLGDLI